MMAELSNAELLKKLENILHNNKVEIKNEIRAINNKLDERLQKLEKEYNTLENKVVDLERKNRENNIVIFGIHANRDNLLNITVEKLNDLLGITIKENDINKIYHIGNKNTILLEFTTFITKQNLFKNIRKLKGTGVYINHDLRPEDQKTHKILYQNLKQARSNNLRAYIRNHILYINDIPQTIDQLGDYTSTQNNHDLSYELAPKANSAPATPQIPKTNDPDKDSIITDTEEVFNINLITEKTSLLPSENQGKVNHPENRATKVTGAIKKTSTSSKNTDSQSTPKLNLQGKENKEREGRSLRHQTRKPN